MRSVTAGILTVGLVSVAALAGAGSPRVAGTASEARPASSEGLAAWQQVYSVLTHPRALTATQQPTIRNKARTGIGTSSTSCVGRRACGVPGLTCATCHQGATSKATGGTNCADCHKGADLGRDRRPRRARLAFGAALDGVAGPQQQAAILCPGLSRPHRSHEKREYGRAGTDETSR